MAIIKMQKLAVVGLAQDKEKLMKDLMDIGVLELTEVASTEESPLEGLARDTDIKATELPEKKAQTAMSALSVLEKYGGLKEPLIFTRRHIKKQKFMAAGEEASGTEVKISKLLELSEKIKEEEAGVGKAEAEIAAITPWSELDIPLEEKETKTADITLGIAPKAEVENFEGFMQGLNGALTEMTKMSNSGSEPAPSTQNGSDATATTASDATQAGTPDPADILAHALLKQVSEDKDYIYIAVLTGKPETKPLLEAAKQAGFSEVSFPQAVGTPKAYLEKLNKEIEAASTRIADLKEQIKKLSPSKEEIENYADFFAVEADRQRIREKLLKTNSTFMLEGWLPIRTKDAVSQILDANDAYYKFRDPEEGEEVPVLLENKSFFAPTEAVTEMYSLPSYFGFDPTSIYSLFYIIFFGMMFSDAGYGLLLAVGCGVILKKFELEGTMYKMIKLFFYSGISTIIWGVLFGGFFGDLIGVFSSTFLGGDAAFNAVWFNPLDDPMKLLIFSLILGVIHLFIGMGIAAYMQIREGKIADAIAEEGVWYLEILGLAAWLGGSAAFDSQVLSTIGMWMSIIGAAGILIAGGRGKKGFGRITGGLANLYNITSWISDILSYARLLALGLATGVIAQVVNTMGSLFGGGVAGLIFFVLVFFAGHAINFAINMLGAFIHSARLQYVEFFGKFYVDGGEAFDPFRRKTKFVRIDEE